MKLIKKGLLDTWQGLPSFGLQHEGIPPGGAMDTFSLQIANALVGNDLYDKVLEMHFPTGVYQFETSTLLAICGADFTACVDNVEVPMNQPIKVPPGAILSCKKPVSGQRVYVATRTLQDEQVSRVKILPWSMNPENVFTDEPIRILCGREWEQIKACSQQLILSKSFAISPTSNRMGYQLIQEPLKTLASQNLLSSAVTAGTIQLLPSGQLVVLMAGHQTTGGYPRLAHVISADLPRLAQKGPGDSLRFTLTDSMTAEYEWILMQNYLQQVRNVCALKLSQHRFDHH
ncbi:biotin-dependent carboxyltransferase family protein [Aquirufa lenticrescens]